jgi:CHAT domain-containing protein/cytochrome c-type biogenesis protein CcmH/NrfG
MRVPKPSPPTSQCIGDAEWLEVATGLLPEAKTRELMKHAAQCGHCGPLLRDVAEALVDEATPSEEALLASLKSARPEWRKTMAATLRDSAREGQQRTSWWRALFAWPTPAYAFAGIAAIAIVAWIGVRTLHPPSADQLLAEAYTERRTFEVRIPGARYAPVRAERGSGSSSLDKPAALLTAEVLISQNLQRSPDDPNWLQARARADLLDGNYDSAVKALQRALDARPDSRELLTDIGSAYFLRGSSTDRKTDYGNAIEALGKALLKDPNNAIALFNHALVCERMFLYSQAVDDWEHYLRVDPRGQWADEARENLKRVKKLLESKKQSENTILSPREFTRVARAGDEANLSVLDQQIERYFDTAVRSWLPQSYASNNQNAVVELRAALDDLAAILRTRHSDEWLTDFMKSASTTPQGEAIRQIVASEDALNSGRYHESTQFAGLALENFQRARNRTGALWATFALMSGASFELRYSDCLRVAAPAIQQVQATKYRRLYAQMLIQQGICQEATTQLLLGTKSTLRGGHIARQFNYPSLNLRATGLGATYLLYSGDFDHSIREILGGLKTFWNTGVTNVSGEVLYFGLSEFAEIRNCPHLDALATKESLNDFPSKDAVDYAVESQVLAEAQERAGDHNGALLTLKRLASMMSALPSDRAVELRRGEIAVENAQIKMDTGDAQGAADLLAGFHQLFDQTDKGQFQAEYFKTYGEALLALGRDTEAEPLLQHGLMIAESYLRELREEAVRLSWSRMQSQLYHDILAIKLRRNSASESLAWWEWYKGASLRTARAQEYFDPPNVLRHPLPANTAVVSYVLDSRLATAFVYRQGQVQARSIQVPSNIESLISSFLRHCSTPSSNLSTLDSESSRLYEVLVAPLEADLQGISVLNIETDGVLDRVPFDLLHRHGAPYIGDRYELSFSPGLDYGVTAKQEEFSPSTSAFIVAAANAQRATLPPLPEAADEAADVAASFHGAKLLSGDQAKRDEVLRGISETELFHFAGHAVVTIHGVGLVLGEDSLLDADDIASLRLRNLKLAVLSGCDTANGSDESPTDVNSLARTMVAAGASSVVASRWPVDSAAARVMMRAFYSELLSGKQPVSSLHAAEVSLRNMEAYRHPYYWGSLAVFRSL